MDIQEFARSIETSPPGPVTLFCPHRGPRAREASYEPLLAERAIERIVALYIEPGMRDMAYNAYFADEADPAEIVSVAETLPFLSERRIVVVRRAERFLSEAAAGPILAYLGNPCPSTLLLFVADSMDRRSKFYKTCDAAGAVVPCPQLRDTEVTLWVHTEVGTRGKNIHVEAVKRLVERTGLRLGDVQNAIHLVCDYVGGKDSIDVEDVEAACADVAEEHVWTLTDAIAASDVGAALRTLRELLDMGVSEFQILGSLNWLLKNTYAVAAKTPSLPRISRFVARKVSPLAHKFGEEKMRDAFSICMDTEILLRSTHVDRALAMELLVTRLAAPVARPARPRRSATR